MRAGGEVRVTVQLVEAPAGTLMTSHAVHAALGDLFRLQDDLAGRIVEALSPPLTRERAIQRAQTPNPGAYELYLRGNELARSYESLPRARDLYLRALELDPDYAPAWAQLGRCHRVIGKFVHVTDDSEAQAEQAFRRALGLDPSLSLAHKFYAALEADIGVAESAAVRLLREAARRGNDPELFAGLVHALRYCGLYDESMAAHSEARRLDPNVTTSIEGTLLLAGDLTQMLAFETAGGGGDEGIRVMGLGLAGRREEAMEKLVLARDKLRLPAFQAWTGFLLAWLERRLDDMRTQAASFETFKIRSDPEAIFLHGWLSCDAGAYDIGLAQVQRAVARGYNPSINLARSPQFDAIRSSPEFQSVVADAEAGRRRALAAFREAGGERLLGRVPADPAERVVS
jgi:tetratricopeptide (TPR) repeat protein